MKYNFSITKTDKPKDKPKDMSNLGFCQHFTDHMFLMDYTEDKGWHDGRIVPYGPLMFDPASSVLHYAIQLFEGMKAYKTKEGKILLFRPEMNARRLSISASRLCMPAMDEELYVEAVKAIVNFDKDWIPQGEGRSLYIRPFMISNDVFVGIRPAKKFLFAVFLSPCGSFYSGGLSPTKQFVEDEYVRTTPGGTGYAKVGGNYAATLISQQRAMDRGCNQVLYLDGIEKKYIDEIGVSNAFFVIDGEVITPATDDGTILKGITRDSVLSLCKKWGYKVSERRISIDEVYEASVAGKLQEAFGTGTATVIAPVGEFVWKDKSIIVGEKKIGELSQRIYDELYGIQSGEREDHMGWTVEI